MIDKIKRAVNSYNMTDADFITVALSGGADSVALLYVMAELKKEYSFSLSAAHLNHNLRGEESNRDEEFCKSLCNKLGIPLITESVDVKYAAEKSGESIETAARRIRYDFLSRVAKGKIATAHTADDNLETVIFNLSRGTDLAGLCGIPPVRDNIIRPLIFCTRKDIENYLNKKGASFCTDSTNYEDNYKRNFIRHNIVPLITEINPSVKTTVVNMCEGIREEKDYIYSNAEALVNSAKVKNGYNADILSANPKGLVKNALSKIIKSETGLSADRKTIDSLYEIVCLGKGKLNFLGNNFSAVSHSLLTFGGEGEDFELVLSADMGEKTLNGYSLSVIDIENYKTFQKVHKKLLFTALDYDKIAGVAVARPRKIGDKITPVGAKITKSLKNIYNEKKIPTAIRGKIPVVADNCGVIMVSGYSVAERVKISEETKQVLVAKYIEEEI